MRRTTPTPQVTHSMLCSGEVLVEAITIDARGLAQHVLRCESCGREAGDDPAPEAA